MLPKLSKIKNFQKVLLAWYLANGRIFPWRKPKLTPYQLVLTEVLLQRTKAETVSKFYPSFFKRYPNWKSLGKASKDELKEILRPLGLSSQRGERLFKLAQEMNKTAWRLPKDHNALDELPMMGQYLSNAAKLLIYNIPAPLLDVNMARVLERYFGERQLSDIRYDPYLQSLAWKVANHVNSKAINWAILDFAALVCKARKPLCETCPLNNTCIYYRNIRNSLFNES